MPYVVGSPPDVAAFLFQDPLRAGRGQPQNKVLWVIRAPSAPALDITARSSGSETVHLRASVDGGNGQIQRSILALPNPGCWHIKLRWGAHHGRLDLAVIPRH